MNIVTATFVLGLVITFANGIGAMVNNSRYVKLKDELMGEFSSMKERLARIETKFELAMSGRRAADKNLRM